MKLKVKKIENDIITHIYFSLYSNDHIDNMIINRIKTDCKNLSKINKNFTIEKNDFINSIYKNESIKEEIEYFKRDKILNIETSSYKLSSIYFILYLLNILPNIKLLSFNIINDIRYTRKKTYEDIEVLSFDWNILEGEIRLSDFFDRKTLDIINKSLIKNNIISNRYLYRNSYFFIKINDFLNILYSLEEEGVDIFSSFSLDLLKSKLEETNPTFLIITDYTPY